MISKADLERVIQEKDGTIIFHHQKKDIDALKKLLKEFEEDHDKIKNNLVKVNYLLTLVEDHPADNTADVSKESVAREDLDRWLEKTKMIFERLYLKHPEELKVSDKELIRKEKIKLLSEHESLKRQLHSLDLIIAKTKFMVSDLQEDLCIDLTGGAGMEAVGRKLIEKFGEEIKDTTYTDGRNSVVRYLEKSYSLNKIKSNSLFDILEDNKIVEYIIDTHIPVNIEYYNYDKKGLDWIQLMGTWKINIK